MPIRFICTNPYLAHSHGCNVTLKAIEIYLKRIAGEGAIILNSVIRSAINGNEEFEKLLITSHLLQKYKKVFDEEPQLLNVLSKTFREFRDAEKSRGARQDARLFFDRMNSEYIELWLNSNRRVRLGKLVFLGPPFLKKLWITRGAFLRFIIWAGDFFLGAAIGVSAVYLLSLFFWSVLWLVVLLSSKIFGFAPLMPPTLNLLDWNAWLLGISGLFAASVGIAGGAVAASTSQRLNANFYFDERNLPLRYDKSKSANRSSRKGERGQSVFPLASLTVTAEWLDEVMLGFSSEPIVYGALLPQLQNIVRPNFSLRLPPVPIGHEPGMTENLGRRLYVARRLLSASFKWAAAPVYRYWQRKMTVGLLRLISSTAFGIPLYEVRNSIVRVSNTIGLPHIFNENVWDVTKHLAGGSSYFESEQERDERYSFLWNSTELEQRKRTSLLWTRISRYQSDIEAHYRAYAAKLEGLESLAKACVVVEERTKEAIGAVGLTHLAYHSDLSICRAVADFIAVGVLPGQATVN